MKIALGSDHAGYEFKTALSSFLKELSYEVTDFGCNTKESCDYPDFAVPLAREVAKGAYDFGILICGSGIGMSIVANKIEGIRAANCCTVGMARLARRHNDANILTLGARILSFENVKEIALAFLSEKFDGGRHSVRVQKLHNLTGK
ncbi:MAG: ribose 5-phosphate isomerase B [Ignavibacteria bacterium]|nr:ribose 5-phosphate isomerase B [Ignavibacteria bacterium]